MCRELLEAQLSVLIVVKGDECRVDVFESSAQDCFASVIEMTFALPIVGFQQALEGN